MRSIKLQLTIPGGLARPALSGLMIMAMAAQLPAQLAPTRMPTAAELTKYDKNKNGVLDPDELAAMEANRDKLGAVLSPDTGTSAREEAVVLSPFEVVAGSRGYQALNTMSGTRFNTRLEDLGASISVVTKEQMADFAMLDMNDVFLYTGNTEGTASFSDFDEVNASSGSIDDMTMQDPNNANRVRGLSKANVALSNFEVSNRVRLDPLDTDGVEISRGPNANIFGVGEPGGTVNIVGASANLQRNKSQIQLRGDSFDGWRASLDVNQVVLKDKLAVRATGVYQHDGFHLKPSGVDEKRLTGYVKYRPFKNTTLTASYQDVRTSGNRPNTISIIDGISYWRSLGSPTYDPVTRTVHGGALDGRVFAATGVPAIPGMFIQAANFKQVFVDRGGIDFIMPNFSVTAATPTTGQQQGYALLLSAPFRDGNQPLMPGFVQVSDKGTYDYTSINLSAMNYFNDETQTTRVSLEQNVFRADRQSLDVQLGWLREDSERYGYWAVGSTSPSAGGNTGRLVVDVAERLLDGRFNPYFLRPFISSPETQALRSPLRNDTYRGQFAYQIDFARNDGWSRWLGGHNVVGYGEYKESTTFNFRYKDYLIAPWTPGIANPNPTAARQYNDQARTTHRFYVGDRGNNASYAPGRAVHGDYPFIWGNSATGAFHYDTVTLGEAASRSTNANFGGTHKVQKTGGLLLQSHFLNARLITTFGRREDKVFTVRTLNPDNRELALWDASGLYFNFGMVNGEDLYDRAWIRNPDGGRDWVMRQGSTETKGAVVRPFRGWSFIDRPADSGTGPLRAIAAALRGLSFHYNESDSFRPTNPAVTITREILPNPRAIGKDYGFSLNLFDGRFYVRVNKYDNRTLHDRGGPSANLAGVLNRIDYNLFEGDLASSATAWVSEANPSWNRSQVDTEVERIMGIPFREELTGFSITEPDQKHSKGHEIEINYNPTAFWTVRASLAENVAFQATLSENVQKWLDQRMPIWTSVIDPRNTDNPATPEDERLWWYGTQAANQGSINTWYKTNFVTGYATAKSLEGLYRPQLSRYSGSLSTNFRLAGITEHSFLKRFNVGGALRYVGKKTIGYYGKQQLPDIITEIDVNRPIELKANLHADVFVAYRVRIWHDKIGATVQLNVRNLADSARLIPTSAWPDGTRKTFRIAAPQQFILTTTFDL